MTKKRKVKAEDWRDGPPGLAWDIIGRLWDEEKLVHTGFNTEDRKTVERLKAEAEECEKLWTEIVAIKKEAEALGDRYTEEVQERTVKTLGAIFGKIRANELEILMFFYPQATDYVIDRFETMKEGELVYGADKKEGERWYYPELFPILSRYGGGWIEGEPPSIDGPREYSDGPRKDSHIVNTPLTKEDEALLDRYIAERMAILDKVFEDVAERIKTRKKAKGEAVYGLSIFQIDNIFKSLYSPKDWSSSKKVIPLNNTTKQNAIVTFLSTPGEDILKKNGFTPYERWVERGVLSFVSTDTKGWSLPMLWRAMVRDQEAEISPKEKDRLKEALMRLGTKRLIVDVEQDIHGKYAMLESIDWEKEGLDKPIESKKWGKTVLSINITELDIAIAEEMKGGHKTEVYYLSRPPFTYQCFSQPTGQYITTPDSWFHPSVEKVERTSSEEGLLRDIAIEYILNAMDMTKNKGWRTIVRYAPILEECEVYPSPKGYKDVTLQPKDLEKLPEDHTEDDVLKLKKKRWEADRKQYVKWKNRLIDFLKAWGEDRYNEGMFTRRPDIGEESIELFIDTEKAFKISPVENMEGMDDKEERRER